MESIAFLLLLVQSAQESEAEKLFKKMEERLTTAKTVQFSFKTEVKSKDPQSIEGTFVLAEGNKFDIAFTHSGGKRNQDVRAISDGTKIAEFTNQKRRDVEPRPEMAAIIRLGVARAGAGMIDGYGKYKSLDTASSSMKVSDFKSGGKEKVRDVESQIIEYSLEIAKVGKASVRVWIDPRTSLPVKSTLTVTVEGEAIVATTTYEGFKIDEPIENAKFKIPEK